MKESFFVEQNKKKWSDFEEKLKKSNQNAEDLRVQLIQVTDDLSFARTFYKNRSVRVYLNDLARKIHTHIYKNRTDNFNSFTEFIFNKVPKISFHSRKVMLFSFIILIFTTVIGYYGAHKDRGFAVSILGESYISLSEENIAKGDPMNIYKSDGQYQMFLMIFINNLRVGFIIFICGLLFSYGSVAIMIYNGIMLGVFMHLFYSNGAAMSFNFTVWMHGTIEILTMVIECAAGMMLGKAFVNPGTLSKYKAFTIWGKRGAMLFLSTIPFILLAAIIESFLTRYTDIPLFLRGIFILLSLGLMLFYFVIYPFLKFKNSKDELEEEHHLREDNDFVFSGIVDYNLGNVYITASHVFIKNISKFLKLSFVSILLLIIYILIFNKPLIESKFIFSENGVSTVVLEAIQKQFVNFLSAFANVTLVFGSNQNILVILPISLILTIISIFARIQIKKTLIKEELLTFKENFKKYIIVFLSNLLMVFLFSLKITNPLYYIVLILLFPLFIAVNSTILNSKEQSITKVMAETINWVKNGKSFLYASFIVQFFLTLLIYFFVFSPLLILMFDFVEINFKVPENIYDISIKSILYFMLSIAVYSSYYYYSIATGIYNYTLYEIENAETLNIEIDQLATNKKYYGLETE